MKGSVIIRFVVIGLLWLGMIVWYFGRISAAGQPITLLTIFTVVASGIIVFVPLYKKYVKNGKSGK